MIGGGLVSVMVAGASFTGAGANGSVGSGGGIWSAAGGGVLKMGICESCCIRSVFEIGILIRYEVLLTSMTASVPSTRINRCLLPAGTSTVRPVLESLNGILAKMVTSLGS